MNGLARSESEVRRESIRLALDHTEGISERSAFSRIKIAMTKEKKGDPSKVSLVLICQWLQENDLETFLTPEELISCISKDTKLNTGAVKRLLEKIPFKIPPRLKPVKIKKGKNKKTLPKVIVRKKEKPEELCSTLDVTVPPRELAYFTKQDQVAMQNKVEIKINAPAQKVLDKYGEQISFIVNQLKGESLESIAQKIANSLAKIKDGKPQDTPLFQIARWFSNNRGNLPDNRIRLVDNIINDTDVIRARVRKLLATYDFDLPDFDTPEKVEVKVTAEVKPERPSEKPQIKIAPSISTEDSGWIETHFNVAGVFKKEEEKIERIELDPSIKKQYILSGPGIEIVIKTGDNKIAVVPEEVGAKIPEGCHGVAIESYRHARHYSDGGYQYCYACKKPFNGAWLRVVTIDRIENKVVPCHTACLCEKTKTMFVRNSNDQKTS